MEFLKDQRVPRIGWKSGKDTLYETRVGNKVSRENKEYDDEKSRQLSAKENTKRPKILPDDIVDD